MSVGLSGSVSSSLLVVQASQAQQARAQAQLASGLKVASPLDDPTRYFQASSLRARADAFDATLDRIGSAKSVVEAGLHGLEAGRRTLLQLRAQVERFAQYLPGETRYETAAELRGGLSRDTDLGSLNDDPYTPGPMSNGRVLQIRLDDASGALIERANFRYDRSGPMPADAPGAATPRFSVRTVGDLVDKINASDLDVTARLENGRLRITADDTSGAIRFLGSRDFVEGIHARRDRIWADEANPSTATSAIVKGRTGLTETTDIASLAPGVTNNRIIRFLNPSAEAARGYTETTFRYRTDGRSDLGGRTVGDFIRFINERAPDMEARLEGGQLVVEGDARGLYAFGHGPMQTALGIDRGTYWGGAVEAPKRLVGAIDGLTRADDAVGSTGFIQDGQGGQVRFRYGTGGTRNGTTLGDFVDTINEAHDRGEVKLKAGFTDDGRVYLESTGGVNALPSVPTWRPIRVTGLTYTREWGAPGGTPAVLPTASDGITQAQWDEFKRLGDTLEQYDGLIRDASFAGRNAALGEGGSVVVNDRGTRLDAAPTLGAASGRLGLEEIEIWDLIEREGFEATLAELDSAVDAIDAEAGRLTRSIAVLEIRETFNRALRGNHEAGADAITEADANEAAAAALAGRTRSQLAFNALTLIAEAERGVLRLF